MAEKRPRIQLVEPLVSRLGSLTSDPKLINAFAEKQEDGSFRVYKRAGVAAYQTLTPPGGVTLLSSVGQFYAEDLTTYLSPTPYVLSFVNTTTLAPLLATYVYFNGVSPVGLAGGSNTIVDPGVSAIQYAFNKVAALLVVTGGGVVAVINLTTKAVTLNGPVNSGMAGGIVELDSTIYAMDGTAVIWGSALNDATSWPGLNFIQAASEPGKGVYLAKHYSYVVAMKEFSLEFFWDAQNPTGSPLSGVPNSTVLWGCVSGGSVQQLGNELFWLARERAGAFFIGALQHLQPVKVSTPSIERIIGDAVGPFYSFGMRDSVGHQYYGLTDIGGAYTIVYDIGQKLWYLWNALTQGYFPYAGIIVHSNNTVIMQSTTGALAGALYQMDEDFVSDLGQPITVDIYTPNQDFQTRQRKMLTRMDFIADQQPGKLYSRYSTNDFKTFSQFREVDLNQERPTLLQNGSFTRRAWNFRYSAPYPLRLEAVELDMQLGE